MLSVSKILQNIAIFILFIKVKQTMMNAVVYSLVMLSSKVCVSLARNVVA